MSALPFIEKDKENPTQHYRYASEYAIKVALQEQFVRYGVLFSISFVRQLDRFDTQSGKQHVYIAEFEITLEDVDSDEKRVFRMVGSGADNADKSVYKAVTGALKYALAPSFLIPTGDDPEGARDEDEPAQQSRQSFSGVSGQQYQPMRPAQSNQTPRHAPSDTASAAYGQAQAPAYANRPARNWGALIAEIRGAIQGAATVAELRQIFTARIGDMADILAINPSAHKALDAEFYSTAARLKEEEANG